MQAASTINYGDRLTALRESKGWTRERLAVAANVSYWTVRNLETNRSPLRLDYAEAIALAYELPMIEFWEWMCG